MACVAGPALASEALVAWRGADGLHWRPLTATSGRPPERVPELVPLGSLWKLFVYAYLADRGAHEPPYRCVSQPMPGSEDEYCCPPGGSVERDQALARSCAPYFDPRRLAIDATDWRHHWQAVEPEAAWLTELDSMAPQTQVAPAQILAAVASVSAAARHRARQALLAVLTEGYGRNAWPVLGSSARFKTYSWHDSTGARIGGGAGWLADGTPFWFSGPGASRQVLDRYAAALARTLPAAGDSDDDEAPCVDVRFFARYPIRSLDRRSDGGADVSFANGHRLRLKTLQDLQIGESSGRIEVTARLRLEDYVARVIDREGNARDTEAAKALAVAARSYLRQEGRQQAGCLAIDDDTRHQRVSANPPSAAARAAARFTEDLTLAVPVRFHKDRSGRNQLAWTRAVALAQAGARFDAILADAYGDAAIGGSGDGDCRRLAEAEIWLKGAARSWRRQLAALPGYEAPAAITVCALPTGNPYSDQTKNRIYVRDWMSAQGRLTLAHEYVHLAFRFHPDGGNEQFVELTARSLTSGVPQ